MHNTHTHTHTHYHMSIDATICLSVRPSVSQIKTHQINGVSVFCMFVNFSRQLSKHLSVCLSLLHAPVYVGVHVMTHLHTCTHTYTHTLYIYIYMHLPHFLNTMLYHIFNSYWKQSEASYTENYMGQTWHQRLSISTDVSSSHC